MVATILPKTAGARPPNSGLPPLTTTFSPDPDDKDSMLVFLTDQIERLIQSSKRVAKEEILTYVNLLDLRQRWIEMEINMEALLHDGPAAPLGLEEDPFDLAKLKIVDDLPHETAYRRLIEAITRAKKELLDRLGDPIGLDFTS